MKITAISAILVVFLVFTSIGCVFIYFGNGGNYQASASLTDNGTVSYSLSGDATQYRYSVFSDTSLPDKIYFYLDDSYPVFLNDYYTQSEFFSVMKQMLERRGYSSVDYVDTENLPIVMEQPNIGIFFITGALPDIVVDDGSFCEWMENGGTVYWTGPEIGRYVLTKDSLVDNEKGFFDGNVNNDEESIYAYNETEMFTYTEMRYDDCLYGLKVDQPNSLCVSYCSEEGYSSVSVAKLFNGNAIIFGDNIAATNKISQVLSDRTCCADLIICGLTYSSHGIDYGHGSMKGSINANTVVDTSSFSKKMFFISVGTNLSNWSKSIDLD